eukprot:TRINITY_DN1118_c1_g1_i1.p1 TRINITY_DN1118_c1_g1~~TRINITY_DN1118_c1_g1_i1.p1  ORF type:complete len:127 (-),score=17.42 TRINITY_DN1118_c1_g1_i1:4-384(-)
MVLLRTETARTEREQLTSQMVSLGTEICESLQKQGTWCDLIDPESGLPFLGQRGSTPYNELEDVAPEELGYKASVHMCCKIATHLEWRVNALLLTLFASLPHTSSLSHLHQEVQKTIAKNKDTLTT